MIFSVAFSADGQSLFSSDQNQSIIEWNLSDETHTYDLESWATTGIAFDEQGERLYMSGLQGKLERLDLDKDVIQGRVKPIFVGDECL